MHDAPAVTPAARLRRCRLELEDVFRALSRAGELPVAARLGLALLDLAEAERLLAATRGADKQEETTR